MTTIIESGFLGNDYPLTHPRILWDNIGRRDTTIVTATSEADGFEAELAVADEDYCGWKPETGAAATLTFTMGLPEYVSALGVVGDFATANATITFQVHQPGGSWETVGSIAPERDGPVLCLCERRACDYVRITVEGTDPATVYVFAAGDALELPVRSYAGHTPIDLSKSITFEENRSETGALLGRSYKYAMVETTFDLRHISEEWYREHFVPFAESAILHPFFVAERPDGYPDAMGYCTVSNAIVPGRMGLRDLVEVSL